MKSKTYICIDLKSFYASVECMKRNLNPLTTNLVVADSSRTEKTICLAVTPSLKALGIPGRARLFDVVQKVKEINYERKKNNNFKPFVRESFNIDELNKHPEYKLSYIVAPPHMAHYIDISSKIYSIYLKYVSEEDIHVYSIDEVFIDITSYINNTTSKEFTQKIIKNVLLETNITATAGIGTNMYLAKVAMDILAKKIPADENGVRIAELDEMNYRKYLWNHKPLKDFWRVGNGYVKRLEKLGLYTMGDIAKCSVGSSNDYYNEDLLYKEFGINAELLIDHAWGYEPTTIKDVKSYIPQATSLSSGQVLSCGYECDKALLIAKEMMDLLSLDLVEKKVLTNQITLYLGYDSFSENILTSYDGPIEIDYYGRKIPKSSHGSLNLQDYTSSTTTLVNSISTLFKKIANPKLLIKRINISANNLIPLSTYTHQNKYKQISLFDNEKNIQKDIEEKTKEAKLQNTIINIKKKYGKNAILKGMNLEEASTAKERNNQIGGHKS